jgi:hypothetical protein
MECFNITIVADDLVEGQELLLLEAESEDAIISGVFDPLSDIIDAISGSVATGDIIGAIEECISEVGEAADDIIGCVLSFFSSTLDFSYTKTPVPHRNSTLTPLLVADGDTAGNHVYVIKPRNVPCKT